MKQPFKKAAYIPAIIYTDLFLRFVIIYTKDFKVNKGYGKYWLKEWTRMENQGLFKPEKLRELYIKILDGSNILPFVCKDAVNTICVQAFNAANTYASGITFDIRLITGEIAVNDDDEELTGLSMDEAAFICDAMNTEAEELLFIVYNSATNKPIKRYGKNKI